MKIHIIFIYLLSILLSNGLNGQRKDIVLYDFEDGKFDQWTLKGDNFLVTGNPVHIRDIAHWARGPVGHKGNYYLETGHNEGRHTNNPKGVFISPLFRITRDFLNFYLAGEVHPNVRVYLEVDGVVVKEAFGNNFYDLLLRGWNVKEYKNRKVRFAIEVRSNTRSLIRLDHIFLSDTPPPSEQDWVKIETRERSSIVAPGEFSNILNNSQLLDGHWVVEHVNIVRGPDNRWHLFGQVMEASNVWDVKQPGKIIHAVSDHLTHGWQYSGVAMEAEKQYGESFLLNPFVVVNEGYFYMFYVGSGQLWSGWYTGPQGDVNPWYLGESGDYGPNSMFLARSLDGQNWERIGKADPRRPGKIFTEKPFGLTPYVHRLNDQWVMYYASATNETVYSKHTIGYRFSKDLVNWSQRRHALIDWSESDSIESTLMGNHKPASPWPEHSFFTNPVVFKRNNHWYLWAGPIDNSNLSRYHCLRIYKSDNPFHFENHYKAKNENKRVFVDGGGQPIQDTDGKWYIYHTNSMSGGVWIAPLFWNDTYE